MIQFSQLNKELLKMRLPLSIKAKLEAALLRLAKRILLGRNVTRALVVSRRDNDEMFEMGWELGKIAQRIETGYKDVH